jgi:CubicO group peptidase (beta-lactamase class C family)
MQEHHSLHSKSNRSLHHPHKVSSHPFSPIRLARLQNAMRHYIDNEWAPGLVTLVHRNGQEYVDVMGSMAFDSAIPMQRNAIFRLASMTKPITAVAAMILVEECKLRLDDPVDEWLPELSDRKVLRTIDSPLDDTVPAKRSITLRDLLTFRSGYGEVEFLAPTCPLYKAMIDAHLPLTEWIFPSTPDEFMQRLGNLPLAFQPGERWLYHMSMEIVGVLISRVAGQSLGQFLRERIFQPLNMNDTGFYVSEGKMDRLPTCYGTDMITGKLGVLDEARGGQMSQPPLFEAGAGGLVSTIDDMAAFGVMFLNKGAYGRERILSRPSVELMTKDHLTPEQKATSPFFEHFWENHGWGLGLGVTTTYSTLGNAAGSFGWDGAFGSSWFVDPVEQLVGVLMIQRRPDALNIPTITRDFWTSVYQLIED